jgi:hypothetical protein
MTKFEFRSFLLDYGLNREAAQAEAERWWRIIDALQRMPAALQTAAAVEARRPEIMAAAQSATGFATSDIRCLTLGQWEGWVQDNLPVQAQPGQHGAVISFGRSLGIRRTFLDGRCCDSFITQVGPRLGQALSDWVHCHWPMLPSWPGLLGSRVRMEVLFLLRMRLMFLISCHREEAAALDGYMDLWGDGIAPLGWLEAQTETLLVLVADGVGRD